MTTEATKQRNKLQKELEAVGYRFEHEWGNYYHVYTPEGFHLSYGDLIKDAIKKALKHDEPRRRIIQLEQLVREAYDDLPFWHSGDYETMTERWRSRAAAALDIEDNE